MSQGTAVGNPALTLVLALFMLGYVLWAADRLAYLSRTPARRPGHRPQQRDVTLASLRGKVMLLVSGSLPVAPSL